MEKNFTKLPRSVKDEGVGSDEHSNSDENERTHMKERKKIEELLERRINAQNLYMDLMIERAVQPTLREYKVTNEEDKCQPKQGK